MFGQNILRPVKEYGHSYGSNANPELSANIHKNCGSSKDRARARGRLKRLEASILLLKKKELVKLCRQFDLPFNSSETKHSLRLRILNS